MKYRVVFDPSMIRDDRLVRDGRVVADAARSIPVLDARCVVVGPIWHLIDGQNSIWITNPRRLYSVHLNPSNPVYY